MKTEWERGEGRGVGGNKYFQNFKYVSEYFFPIHMNKQENKFINNYFMYPEYFRSSVAGNPTTQATNNRTQI